MSQSPNPIVLALAVIVLGIAVLTAAFPEVHEAITATMTHRALRPLVFGGICVCILLSLIRVRR